MQATVKGSYDDIRDIPMGGRYWVILNPVSGRIVLTDGNLLNAGMFKAVFTDRKAAIRAACELDETMPGHSVVPQVKD